MGAILREIIDPRDNLERAKRDELVDFAKAQGIPHSEINEQMPAILIRRVLRSKGLIDIKIPSRPLGGPEGGEPIVSEQNIEQVNAEDDLVRQYQQQSMQDVSTMSFHDMRRACRDRGIQYTRRDNMDTLRAKLNGQDASASSE